MVPMARVPVPSGKLSAEALYEYALRALARRSHTVAELEAKIRRRCAEEEDVDAVVEKLRRHGYLDDARVAESHTAIRRDFNVLGRKRVLVELKRRGVEEGMAEEAVADSYEDCDESELARIYLRRKIGALADGGRIEDPKRIARLFRALARAGFDSSAITDALRDVSADGELLDELAEASVASDPAD